MCCAHHNNLRLQKNIWSIAITEYLNAKNHYIFLALVVCVCVCVCVHVRVHVCVHVHV